jgi:nucleotide-binding universal stress UspA family protein
MVLGYDHTPESRDAFEVAVDLSGRLSAFLHVVHAIDRRDYPIDLDLPNFAEEAEATLAEERRVATALLHHYLCGWTYLAGLGDPGRLLSVADEHKCDHDRRRLERRRTARPRRAAHLSCGLLPAH